MPLAQLPSPDCLKSLGESREVCTPIQGLQLIFNPHWGTFTFKTVSLAGGKIPYTQSLYVRQSCLHG